MMVANRRRLEAAHPLNEDRDVKTGVFCKPVFGCRKLVLTRFYLPS